MLWFAQNSLPLRWQRQPIRFVVASFAVVICSKFITFAVTKTTLDKKHTHRDMLWFAQNSLPLRWQRQRYYQCCLDFLGCDLLKIHYLCGDKDNKQGRTQHCLLLWFAQNSLPLRWQRQLSFDKLAMGVVVICSKFITFAVTKTTICGSII